MNGRYQVWHRVRAHPVLPWQCRIQLQLQTHHANQSWQPRKMDPRSDRFPGQMQLAFGVSVTGNTKETSFACFQRDMNAQSSVGPRQSLLKTLGSMHNAWLGCETEGDSFLPERGPRDAEAGRLQVPVQALQPSKRGAHRPWSPTAWVAAVDSSQGYRERHERQWPCAPSAPLDVAAVCVSDVSWCPELSGLPLGEKSLKVICSFLCTRNRGSSVLQDRPPSVGGCTDVGMRLHNIQ